MVSTFRGIIDFFDKVGIYDVILPFLLVFTIIFAVLEKSKIFGTEKIGSDEYTKKNLNSMVAFVVAFLVVASSKIVGVINKALPNVVLLILLSICFLLMIGTFWSSKQEVFLDPKSRWFMIFMVIMFVGIILIFLDALNWLVPGWEWLMDHWSSNIVGSAILILVVVGMIAWITKDEKPGKEAKS